MPPSGRPEGVLTRAVSHPPGCGSPSAGEVDEGLDLPHGQGHGRARRAVSEIVWAPWPGSDEGEVVRRGGAGDTIPGSTCGGLAGAVTRAAPTTISVLTSGLAGGPAGLRLGCVGLLWTRTLNGRRALVGTARVAPWSRPWRPRCPNHRCRPSRCVRRARRAGASRSHPGGRVGALNAHCAGPVGRHRHVSVDVAGAPVATTSAVTAPPQRHGSRRVETTLVGQEPSRSDASKTGQTMQSPPQRRSPEKPDQSRRRLSSPGGVDRPSRIYARTGKVMGGLGGAVSGKAYSGFPGRAASKDRQVCTSRPGGADVVSCPGARRSVRSHTADRDVGALDSRHPLRCARHRSPEVVPVGVHTSRGRLCPTTVDASATPRTRPSRRDSTPCMLARTSFPLPVDLAASDSG